MFDKILGVATAVALAALLATPARAADNPPTGAVPLTAPELYMLYAGKTWVWPNGGGGYTASDRSFVGAAIDGQTQSYADGRWLVTNSGQLCWRATWHGSAGAAPARTCFDHMQKAGVIYQRSLPKGNWYIFAHNPRQAGDEINQLKAGNVVTAGYAEAKAFLNGGDSTKKPAEYASAKGAKK